MMLGTNQHIDFEAPAILRKWPSIKNERASESDSGVRFLRPALTIWNTVGASTRRVGVLGALMLLRSSAELRSELQHQCDENTR
jgi:hypothetical protein